ETTPLLRLSAGAEAAPEALRQARALTQALERRHATVLSIAAELVARQDAHLRDAATPPAAVTINEVAASVGVHRSTVSRVTAALTMALPRRTISLRALVSAPAPAARRLEKPPSVQAVLERMQAVVAAADPVRALAPPELAPLRLSDGAAVARRPPARRAPSGVTRKHSCVKPAQWLAMVVRAGKMGWHVLCMRKDVRTNKH